MFTGIVEEVGTVSSTGGNRLVVRAIKVLEGTELGDSIAVNGVCLTVIALGGETFTVEIMPETLRRTNLGDVRAGDAVNLERALALGDRLGGHLVQGHIDATGRIESLVPEGDAVLMTVSAPPEIMRYLVGKGYVAVDGISLTVVRRELTAFTVSLVTFTRESTSLKSKRVGDRVNLEVDIIAKYVEQHLSAGKSGITHELLREHGFA